MREIQRTDCNNSALVWVGLGWVNVSTAPQSELLRLMNILVNILPVSALMW